MQDMKKPSEKPRSVTESLCVLSANYWESRKAEPVPSLGNISLQLECISNDLAVSVNTTSISRYSQAVSLDSKRWKNISNALSHLLTLIGIKFLSVTPGTNWELKKYNNEKTNNHMYSLIKRKNMNTILYRSFQHLAQCLACSSVHVNESLDSFGVWSWELIRDYSADRTFGWIKLGPRRGFPSLWSSNSQSCPCLIFFWYDSASFLKH